MSEPSPITREIQRLREQLDALLSTGRTIGDSEVMAISREMDRLVLLYYDGDSKAAGESD